MLFAFNGRATWRFLPKKFGIVAMRKFRFACDSPLEQAGFEL